LLDDARRKRIEAAALQQPEPSSSIAWSRRLNVARAGPHLVVSATSEATLDEEIRLLDFARVVLAADCLLDGPAGAPRTIGDPGFDQVFVALHTLQTLLPHGQSALREYRIHIAVQKTLYVPPLRRNFLFQFGYFTLARLKLPRPVPVVHSHH
jgi:hypothetical protein